MKAKLKFNQCNFLIIGLGLLFLATHFSEIKALEVSDIRPRSWFLESHQLLFSLTPEDFSVHQGSKPGRAVFSVRQQLQEEKERQMQLARLTVKENRKFYLNLPHEMRMMNASQELFPLSTVGTLISFRRKSFGMWPGAAHPYAEQIFVTVDVSQEGQFATVSLLDLYSEKEVVSALAQAPFLQEHFTTAEREFRDLEQLIASLQEPE